jgi:hypothetical protein
MKDEHVAFRRGDLGDAEARIAYYEQQVAFHK